MALASKDVVERPKSSNRGEPIDTWRRALDIDHPVPWCAVFGSYKARSGKVRAPVVWSVSARDFAVKGHCWKVSDVIYKRYVPKPGDYRVKTRRGGNHVDIFVTWDARAERGTIIGGNVADRVKLRKLSLKRMIVDGTTHITEVEGCHRYYPAVLEETSTNKETVASEEAELSES